MDKSSVFKAMKKRKKLLLAAAALVGALLIILPKNEAADPEGVALAEYKAQLEDELEDMISTIDGVGRCSVTVSFSDGERYSYSGSRIVSVSPPSVLGVSVVCEGGGSPEVSSRIVEALTALYGIGSNRVCVLKMKK